MRKIAALVLFALAAAPTAFAQQQPANSFSMFVSPGYYSHTDEFGSSSSIGYGIGYRHMFNDRFALDAAVSRFRQTGGVVVVDQYQPYIYGYTTHTVPVDVVAQYLFRTESRWKPYVGAGVHAAFIESSPRASSLTTTSPEVMGGVTFTFARTWGAFVEGRQLITSTRVDDPSFRASAGLRFSF